MPFQYRNNTLGYTKAALHRGQNVFNKSRRETVKLVLMVSRNTKQISAYLIEPINVWRSV